MTTTTPNMNLVLPDVGITTGPQWATLIDAAYTLIDSHDHSSGNGIRVTPSGLNISSDLTFAQHNATNLRSARLYNNSAIILGVNDKTCLYSLNNELYYVDGAGNNVQVTISGALNISTSITALTLKDTGFFLTYFGDVTKKVRFDVASIPTATTRILSIPDSGANDTFIIANATQTLTAKTLTGSVLSGNTATTLISGSGTLVLNTTGTQTLQNATDTIVSRTTTDTLTNKILTGNTIASFTPNGGTNTLTAPVVNGTLSVITASETLTNKTLTSPILNSPTLNTSIIPSYETITKTTVPATPSAGTIRVYASSVDGLLHFVNSAGADVAVGTGTSSTSAATTSSAGTITREGIWTAYTPSFGAGFGTVSGITGYYKVLGDSLLIRVNCTAGTVAVDVGSISLPGGFTISTSKALSTTVGSIGPIIGSWSQNISSALGNMILASATSTSLVYIGGSSPTTLLLTSLSNASTVLTTSSPFSCQFEVPLV